MTIYFQGYPGPNGPVGPPGQDGDKVRKSISKLHIGGGLEITTAHFI